MYRYKRVHGLKVGLLITPRKAQNKPVRRPNVAGRITIIARGKTPARPRLQARPAARIRNYHTGRTGPGKAFIMFTKQMLIDHFTRRFLADIRPEIDDGAAGDFTEWAEALAEFLLNHLETVLSADF